MVAMSSWGRLSSHEHSVVTLGDRTRVKACLKNSIPGLAYGMGRSYGDVCLNPQGALWVTTGLDRFIAFDDSTGRLVCEAGVLLRDIQRVAIPRGWILPVTPGTQLVTVGGAIANDVHGKNHHVLGLSAITSKASPLSVPMEKSSIAGRMKGRIGSLRLSVDWD